MKTRALVVALTVAAVGLGLGVAQDAGATTFNCPPKPASGTTVNGNLNVTGTCVIFNVHINGSVTVQSGGKLELDASVVTGNVTVNAGGEFDSGATLGTGAGNGKPSVVRGRVIFNNGTDMDFVKGAIQGGAAGVPSLAIDGLDNAPKVCGAGLTFGASIKHVPVGKKFRLGDPDGSDGSPCPGNGSRGNILFQDNPGTLVMESNGVVGNVTIINSTVKFQNNTVQGNLTCGTGGHITAASGNSISGTNNC